MSNRAALVGPPTVTLMACLALAIASFIAWGAADSVGYPGWAPAAGGLLFALPVGGVSAYALLRLWLATFEDFRLVGNRALVSGAAFALIAAMAIAYTLTAGSGSSYEADFNVVTGRFDPVFNLNTFVITSGGLGLFFAGLLALTVKHFSRNAISHAVDEVEGPDPMGALMEP